MRYTPGPTLDYGQYDPPIPIVKYFSWLLFTIGVGITCALAMFASDNLADAALYAGRAGLERKAALNQPEKKGEEITNGNREWLSNNANEWSK